jgi:putative NIF3 family GTP cyclohydrolase 1 type 2
MVRAPVSRLTAVQVATPATELPIQSIAVCAGSGGGVLRGVKADLLLTGEMSHVNQLGGLR